MKVSLTVSSSCSPFPSSFRFVAVTGHLKPMELVDTLNRVFSAYDSLTEKHQVYKVETIGR